MKHRWFSLLGVGALVLAFGSPGVAASPDRTFTRLNVGGIDPQLRPAMLDSSRQVTVILQLVDKPVLQRGGAFAGRQAHAEEAAGICPGEAWRDPRGPPGTRPRHLPGGIQRHQGSG